MYKRMLVWVWVSSTGTPHFLLRNQAWSLKSQCLSLQLPSTIPKLFIFIFFPSINFTSITLYPLTLPFFNKYKSLNLNYLPRG